LYRVSAIREQRITSRDFDVLQQILVQAFAEGWRVQEVAFTYQPRRYGGRMHEFFASASPACARLVSSGSSETRSSRRTTMTARTTAELFLQRYYKDEHISHYTPTVNSLE
jgi:hypothetical protein